MTDVWDKVYSGDESFFGENPSHFALMSCSDFNKHRVKKLLELGCGQGRDTFFFASNDLDVHALDSSSIAIENLYEKTGLLISNDVMNIFKENLRPSVRVVMLMIITAGIAYPLLLVLIVSITLPFQSSGSLLTFDEQVVGSKLIAQEFKSDKLFHIRPAANSTSTVDPHITPDDAYSQIPRISKATGLPQSTLKTAIQYNVEKNKVMFWCFLLPM
jgi:hypothetical protein